MTSAVNDFKNNNIKDSFNTYLDEDPKAVKEEFQNNPEKFKNRLENILEEGVVNGKKLTQEEREKLIDFLSVFSLDEIRKIIAMTKEVAESKKVEIKTNAELSSHQHAMLEYLDHVMKAEFRKVAYHAAFSATFGKWQGTAKQVGS